jgi:hypothetical protein
MINPLVTLIIVVPFLVSRRSALRARTTSPVSVTASDCGGDRLGSRANAIAVPQIPIK